MIGALLLLASTLASVGATLYSGSLQDPASSVSLVSDTEPGATEPAANTADAITQAPAKQKGRFRIHLFLFRR